ncbi:MAG: S8 family serine peptidase [Anaerolineales bacterium]|nr:S8 family serine peptidase [Anaerolineales bacterium]
MTGDGRTLFTNVMRFNAQTIELTLRGRTFTPGAGLDPELAAALPGTPGLHAFAQLKRLPTADERAALEAAGIRLVTYVGDTLYTAFVTPTPDPASPIFKSLVRWLGLIKTTDKVDPKIQANELFAWAANADGTINLLVTFHADVSDQTAIDLLSGLGATATLYGEHLFAVVIAKTSIETLAQQDPVSWIEEGPAPMQVLNDQARIDLNVNNAQLANTGVSPAFYAGLDGSGVAVGIFDTGLNASGFSHNDFSGRVLRTQDDGNGHGSHVAGIIGASGANSVSNCPFGSCTAFQLRGMAPNAKLAPYGGWNAGTWNEAVNTYHIEVSNHSYVMTCGAYDATAQAVDQLVRGEMTDGSTAIPRHTVVWAAANQGGGAQYCTTGTVPDGSDPDTDPDPDPTTGPRGYFSVLSPSKNIITVGAFSPGSVQSIASFSSRGPTWDGRLKPEIMAPGCMDSTDHDSQGYVPKCGTSMASPAIAGVTALLTEQYHQSFPSKGRAREATMKAILVQTATDMRHEPTQGGFTEFGWNDPDTGQPLIYHAGPDWSTGYGAANAQKAAGYIKAHNFVEGTVSPGDTSETYNITVVPGTAELKFTLAWDDEPGNPAWGVQATQLVNNLDLTLTAPDGVTVWRPWVLPPLPRAALNGSNQDIGTSDPIVRATHVVQANRAVDNLNNLEQVQVPNPVAGVWTIRVNAAALPNGNSQPYTLAGDFRTLNIVDPQTGNVAEAGDPANPNVIQVVLEATSTLGGPSSFADAATGDFSVQIDGANASILSGAAVGDQFWLMVKPQSGVYSAGSKYDLGVTWTGHGSDSETRAVLFTEREITDRAIVVDHSGSMSDYDKMAAAQNAARLFVDQSLPDDRIAVVSFSTGATVNYGITQVPGVGPSAVLDAAKTAINGLTPDDLTAIGKGLLEGQNQVTAAPAAYSVADVVILLSDGMENVDPYYDTPAVKGVIEPTDTIVHTVGVGPSSAGFHALLEEIADDNGGEFRAVNETGTTMAAAGVEAVSAVATGIDAWPTKLPNRLGDVYKQYAEEILDESRLFQARGAGLGRTPFDIEVPDNLARVTFALNWSKATSPQNPTYFLLMDPNQKNYFDPKSPQGGICRVDATHQTCIVEKPQPGIWKVLIVPADTSDNEWMFWVSAKTSVNFQLFVGTPPSQRTIGAPIQILGFLSQGEKPLAAQSVQVRVYGPDGFVAAPMKLFDDGEHGDGEKGDAIYANWFEDGHQAGAYSVRGVASGVDTLGKPFTLLKNTGFHLMPRVVYIHKGDLDTADAYRDLIQAHGIGVDQLEVGEVGQADLKPYSLVIVGPETGTLDQWGDGAALENIRRNKKPVLGLGEGGYAFFGKLGLAIGYANGAHGAGTSVLENLTADPIWHYPYDFSTAKNRIWKLYVEDSPRVDIFLGDQPAGVQPFGFYVSGSSVDTRYSDITMQSGWYMLWSFQHGPKQMTAEGRQLFVNTVYRTLP